MFNGLARRTQVLQVFRSGADSHQSTMRLAELMSENWTRSPEIRHFRIFHFPFPAANQFLFNQLSGLKTLAPRLL
jgi:hypothetical protein